MPSLCPTCQLYVPSSGRCVEYGLVTGGVEHCPKYVEDYFVTGRMRKMAVKTVEEKAASEETKPETAPVATCIRPKVPPEVEQQILALGKQGLTPWKIMRKLNLGSTSAILRVFRENGLPVRKSAKPQDAQSIPTVQVPHFGDCPDCCHEIVCAIKDKVQANRDWAICRHWMAKAQAQKGA